MLQQTYFGLGEIQYAIKTNFTCVFSRWLTWLLENAASHRLPLHLYATPCWRLANFSSKYFELCGPYGFCCICSTQPLRHESCHRQRVNKRTWPCSNKTSFFFFLIKTDGGMDLAQGSLFRITGFQTSEKDYLVKCIFKKRGGGGFELPAFYFTK